MIDSLDCLLQYDLHLAEFAGVARQVTLSAIRLPSEPLFARILALTSKV